MALKDLRKFKQELEKPAGRIIAMVCKTIHVNEECQKILLSSLRKELPEIEDIHLNGLEVDATAFHAELSTIPMFDNGRLIWLRHGDAILKKIETNKTVAGYFARDLVNLPDNTYLLLQLDEAKLPRMFKELNNLVVYEEPTMRSGDLLADVKNRIDLAGFKAEPGVAEMIAEKSAWDYRQAIAGLDRLFTYCLDEKHITKNDVKEICYDMEGDLYFSFIDSLAGRQVSQALKKFNRHRFADASQILSGIAKLFSDAFRYQKYRQLQLDTTDIHKRLGLNTGHSYVMKKNNERFAQLLNQYRSAELVSILDRLTVLDQRLKENPDSSKARTLVNSFLSSLA